MGYASRYHGSLVAFEGPQDVVSTQMRLLPTSPKIMVLPPLEHFLAGTNTGTTTTTTTTASTTKTSTQYQNRQSVPQQTDSAFDPRAFILRIHEACNARADMAHAFLQGSTQGDKRLVFMNGGTASAQLACVSAIRDHIMGSGSGSTTGSLEQAEAVFAELVRNGLAGLASQQGSGSPSGFRSAAAYNRNTKNSKGGRMGSRSKGRSRKSSPHHFSSSSSSLVEDTEDEDGEEGGDEGEDDRYHNTNNHDHENAIATDDDDDDDHHHHHSNDHNDPISKAMRAADALDRETEALQPSTELDLTTASSGSSDSRNQHQQGRESQQRRRSTSLPMKRLPEELHEAAPFYVFGGPDVTRSLPARRPDSGSVSGGSGGSGGARKSRSFQGLDLSGLADRTLAQNPRLATLRALTGDDEDLDNDNDSEGPSCIGEAYGSGASEAATSAAALATPAVIEEARVVDVRSGSASGSASPIVGGGHHKRIKSMDRLYASGVRNQDIALVDGASNANGTTTSNVNTNTQHHNIDHRRSQPTPTREPHRWGMSVQEKQILRSKFFAELPRPGSVATYGRASRTTIRRGPPSPLILTNPKRRPLSYVDRATGASASYVSQATSTRDDGDDSNSNSAAGGLPRYADRGVDAVDVQALLDGAARFELGPGAPFQTVLPMVEDMVVYFHGENDNSDSDALRATIQGFRDGSFPISMPPLLPPTEDDDEYDAEATSLSEASSSPTMSRQSTPCPDRSSGGGGVGGRSDNARVRNSDVPSPITDPSESADEYDPFASHGDYLRPPGSWPTKQSIIAGDQQQQQQQQQEQQQQSQLPKVGQAQVQVQQVPVATPTTVDITKPPAAASSVAHLQTASTTTPPRAPRGPRATRSNLANLDKTFHDFATGDCKTAVCMQNSLRSILNIYFSPSEDAGYGQFGFPLLPELSGLWKPVFRDTDAAHRRHGQRKVDLILAVGAQQGVDKDFLGAITGSLEKLGAKPSGVTRSGRLDLRFLIANAMQAFTAQPLANQTHDNPFSNSMLLATLIIPFLEVYLAAHQHTRFLLLEYPPEHLTTVLALQKLVGVELLKVAGILDERAHEPKPYPGFKVQQHHRHSVSRSVSGQSVSSSRRTSATLYTPSRSPERQQKQSQQQQQQQPLSFSRANFLLTSSASESEIASFISTIWKILIDVSPFYIPDGAPGAGSSNRNSVQSDRRRHSGNHNGPKALAQSPLIDPAMQYAPLASAAVLMGFQSPTEPAPTTTTTTITVEQNSKSQLESPLPSPTVLEPEAAAKPSRAASLAGTIKTVRTMASQRSKLRQMLGRDAVQADDKSSLRPEVVSYAEISDDEDNRFAEEERKYMPLYMRGNEVRKGNSRKALKWLGLSIEE